VADLTALRRAVVLAPQDPAARLALAEALFAAGEARAAAEQLEKLLAYAPGHTPARRLLARAYAKDGRDPLARDILEKEIRAYPLDVGLRDELAEVYEAACRWDDALLQREVAARLDPASPRRPLALGTLLWQTHRPFQAVALLSRALERFPGDEAIGRELAKCSQELRLSESPRTLKLAPLEQAALLLADPALAGPLQAAGLDTVAQAIRENDLLRAKRELVLAAGRSQGTSLFHVLRAELQLAQGDGPAAEASYQRALECAPPSPAAHLRLGDRLFVRGDRPGARARYEAALASMPSLAGDRLAMLDELEKAERAELPSVGRAAALGWTPCGGAVSPIAAVVVPGPGFLRLSGNLGPTGREAAELAFTCLKAHAGALGIEARLPTHDLHLHFADVEIGKDGLSSSLAFALAGLSAYGEKPLRPRLAATGLLGLSGDVLAIGGVHEKLVAAALSGVRRVLLPRANLRDLSTLPPEVGERVEIVPVGSVTEATRLALA